MTPDSASPRIAPTQEGAAAALRTAGIGVPAGNIDIRQRDDRFAALLPGDLIAWFATTPAGDARLAREKQVLDLLQRYCRFSAPRVLEVHEGWQLRQLVPGSADPWTVYRRVLADDGYARQVGAALGTMLADQHLSVPSTELEWLPRRSSWPAPLSSIAATLPAVIDDTILLAEALGVIETYEQVKAATVDRVLTHGDLGLHNLAFAPDGSVAGIFDYDDAAFSDRHDDFEFLLFDNKGDALLMAAIATYTSAGGAPIASERVALFNAANAVGFLADRIGSDPLDRPAGRTLDEDLAWTRAALARL